MPGAVQKSRLKQGKEFDGATWVVSVINSGEKLGGHAVLVVEGLLPHQETTVSSSSAVHAAPPRVLFVGQYDINAVPDDADQATGSLVSVKNRTGRITKVNMRENDHYAHPKGDEFYQRQSTSFLVLKENVDLMIESIRADHEKVEAAKRGEEEYPKFQQFGSKGGLLQALFSEGAGGMNCAEWCIEKLAAGGVEHAVKPKPERVAGGCVLV